LDIDYDPARAGAVAGIAQGALECAKPHALDASRRVVQSDLRAKNARIIRWSVILWSHATELPMRANVVRIPGRRKPSLSMIALQARDMLNHYAEKIATRLSLRRLAEQLLDVTETGGRAEVLHHEDTFNRLIVGEALLASNNYVEAEEAFSSAIALNGESAMLLRGRGDALAGLGYCHQALADYERALAMTIARASKHRAETETKTGAGRSKAADEWFGRLGRFEAAISGLQRRRNEMLRRLDTQETHLAN
jgi:tetratricopeptide (TPR) repeat protein